MKKNCGLEPEIPVVIGVSGGPDSMCLLDILEKEGYKVIVGHFNHGLRLEANTEAEYVQDYCGIHGIHCFTEKMDVQEYAKNHRLSVEEAGRKLRYQFLFRLAKSQQAQAVVVAHNADDQVETILMHLLRGSGMAGLKGMDYRLKKSEWSSAIPLVRPLLDYYKEDILEYCRANELNPALDKSNEDRTYFRNRLRMELVPYLKTYNPEVKDRLIHMSNVVRVEDEFLQSVTAEAIKNVVTSEGTSYFVISLDKVMHLHPAVAQRMLYSMIKILKPETPNITYAVILKGINFLQNPTRSGKIALLAGLELFRYMKDKVVFSDSQEPLDDLWPQIGISQELKKEEIAEISLNGNWMFATTEETDLDRADAWHCSLDADQIDHLMLDTFTNGDRFLPCGMNGKSLKLGDYWTNEGLPKRARAKWPLLRSGEEIIWVPGFRISEKSKITERTRRIISFKIYKK